MATRLQELTIEELSGVKNPANMLPGWLVQKSTDSEGVLDVDAVLKEVDRMESDFAILYSALEASKQYLADADEETQAAAEKLIAYIESLFGEDVGEEDPAAEAPVEAPVALSADEKPTGLLAKLTHKDKPVTKEETPEETPDEPVTEPETEVEKTEDESVTKSDIADIIKEALVPVVDAQTAQADALSATLDRVGNLEAAPTRLSGQELEVAKSTDENSGGAALRSALTSAARGNRVTLG